MAHPLTVHPPSTLPFQSASRPSPLSFGFGIPSGSSPLSFGVGNRSSVGGGFGFGGPSSSSSGSPSKRPLNGSRPPITPLSVSPAFRTTPSGSLKRPRRSPSPTPSSSPSPTSSNIPSPHLNNTDLLKGKEKVDLSVGALALKEDDGDRRMTGRKDVKRFRKEVTLGSSSMPSAVSEVDVGVLLATLPASAHLPILLNLLANNPSLNTDVLARLPRPDQNECLAQLDKYFERIKQGAGSSLLQLNPERAWSRVQKNVNEYCRTASTYINYFSSSSRSPPEPQTIHALLNMLSTQIYFLLRLIPSSADVTSGTTKSLLDLGKTVITSWNQWLTLLSTEVNQRGGMYPHSIVDGWAANLDTLATNAPLSTPSWSTSAFSDSTKADSHVLVDSFQSAMVPLRDRFVAELGWLVGRRPPPPPSSAFHQALSFNGGGINNPWSSPQSRAVTAGVEDEEL